MLASHLSWSRCRLTYTTARGSQWIQECQRATIRLLGLKKMSATGMRAWSAGIEHPVRTVVERRQKIENTQTSFFKRRMSLAESLARRGKRRAFRKMLLHLPRAGETRKNNGPQVTCGSHRARAETGGTCGTEGTHQKTKKPSSSSIPSKKNP